MMPVKTEIHQFRYASKAAGERGMGEAIYALDLATKNTESIELAAVWRFGLLIRVVGAALLLALASNAYAASVSLVQTTTIDLDQVQVGDVVTFDIDIDFTDGPTLGGSFDIVYDSSVILLVGFVRDPAVGMPDFSRDPDSLPDLLESWAIGDFNDSPLGIPDIATLGNVTFQVLPGIGPNTVVAVAATNGIGGPWISGTDFLTILNPTYNQVLLSYDTDGDGDPNASDPDDDNDGQSDADESACGSDPLDAGSLSADNDADGVPDCADPDDDNDGVVDGDDAFPLDPDETSDNDDDGVGDNADPDDDNDGQSDADESACGSDPLDGGSVSADNDLDNAPDCVDPDDDNDGLDDVDEVGGLDPFDPDTDDDWIGDALDKEPLVENNFVPCRGAGMYKFSEVVVGDLTCAANTSIEVSVPTEVMITGNLYLISPLVIFDPKNGTIKVIGSMTVIAEEPCPGCP